ncbi:MAG TPA: hypothetical protein VFN67_29055 [Polyangiales bacterium]|nr:hypothetical protein [Polyangiales bacterium]
MFFATDTDLIHVALASGTTNSQSALEVISFEGAGRDQANWVVLDTIDALKQKYKAKSVKFAQPFWA